MQFIKPDISISFEKYWPIAATISGILVLISLFILFNQIYLKKTFNWGTDFAGGTEVQVQFAPEAQWTLAEVRKTLADGGFQSASVVSFGEEQQHEVLIRVQQTSEKDESISSVMMAQLQSKFGEQNVQLRRVDEVGPKVGRELKINGMISMFLAMIGILVYVWFRFTPRFAPGAIIALLHDIIITLGVFAVLKHQFDLPTVAALLTIVGYSINDTIVVYDRIRDRMKRTRRGELTSVVVRSINETLSRTLLTSVTTFVVVLALFLKTQGGIREFALILIIGIIVGTYSSIFVATPVLVFLEKYRSA